MGKHRKYPIKPIDNDEAWGYRGPVAPMTDQERQWIKNVINERRVVQKPIEKPIEIPKGYLSYWESSAERDAKRLNRQHKFLVARLKGLAEAVSRYSKRGQTPPKELWNAHRSYLEAVAYIEAQLCALRYALRDVDIIISQEVSDA